MRQRVHFPTLPPASDVRLIEEPRLVPPATIRHYTPYLIVMTIASVVGLVAS